MKIKNKTVGLESKKRQKMQGAKPTKTKEKARGTAKTKKATGKKVG